MGGDKLNLKATVHLGKKMTKSLHLCSDQVYFFSAHYTSFCTTLNIDRLQIFDYKITLVIKSSKIVLLCEKVCIPTVCIPNTLGISVLISEGNPLTSCPC